MTTPFPFVASQVLTAQQLNDIQNLPISDKTASYTLIAGDVTKRTMMNSASATTITVNNSIFTVGDVIQIANKGSAATVVTAGAGVTINTSGSLSLAQYGGGYLVALSASSFVFFNLGAGNLYGVATGGTSSSITVSSEVFTLLSFTSDSNLVVSKAGLFDVVLIGGGGAGGGTADNTVQGGGGGAGGTIGIGTTQTIYLSVASYAVDVGAGAAGGTGTKTNIMAGEQSKIGTVIYVAGGGSGGSQDNPSMGCPGGSGGGAARNSQAGGQTIGGLGFAGIGALGGGGGGTGGAPSGSTGGIGLSLSTFTGGTITTTVAVGGDGNAGSSAATGIGRGGFGATPSGTTSIAGGAGSAGAVYVRFKV